MVALGIALSFLTIGLIVVFVAMSGGPKGARRALRSESRRSTRMVGFVAGGVAIAFGVVVPALTLALAGGPEGGPAGVTLSDVQAEGQVLFAENCATCHALDAVNAVGRVGPDLDRLRPDASLTLDAIREGRARGMGQMPAMLVTGENARAVAEYVEAVAGRTR